MNSNSDIDMFDDDDIEDNDDENKKIYSEDHENKKIYSEDHENKKIYSEDHKSKANISKNEKRNLQTLALNTNKAGMEGLDTAKINDIIQKTSEGSKFYLHKQKCQEKLDAKVAQLKGEAQKLTEEQIRKAEEEMTKLGLEMDRRRDLSKTIVHIDMDMFYAAVEMRDDPSLKDKPMAVGGSSMLSTSNYAARKYGVRAAMPGFIARKLCPDLIIVPCNFDKYREVSAQMQKIFEEYDPQFCPMSLDEAYLDITDYIQLNAEKYCEENSDSSCAELVVQEIRRKIEEKTQLTASAGIAANTMLAKVCSDMNKPNGQYFLFQNKEIIQNFMKDLPIRKVSGIGSVTEQHLRALGVIACSDLWTYRGLIRLLFSETSYRHFLSIAMGMGSTHITPATERDRKSISNETTFSSTSDRAKLSQLCEDLCRDLKEDMVRKDLLGKVFTLKMKTTNFQIRTRAQTLMEYTQDENIMISVAQKLLTHEMDAEPACSGPLSLRLLGVRMSSLIEGSQADNKKQKTLTEMFVKKSKLRDSEENSSECLKASVNETTDLESECIPNTSSFFAAVERNNNNKNNNNNNSFASAEGSDDLLLYTCPVCSKCKFNDVEILNKHIDICLNLETVHQLVKETNLAIGPSSTENFGFPSGSKPVTVKSDTANFKSKRKSTGKYYKEFKKPKIQSSVKNTLHRYLELQ